MPFIGSAHNGVSYGRASKIVVAPSLITQAFNATTSGGTSVAVSFTAAAYSVVVVISGSEQTTATTTSPTSVSGLGLTWASKSSLTATVQGGGTNTVAVWYAINNSASAATGTVTVNYSAGFDDASVIVCSFSGCKLSNPWSTAAPASRATTGTSVAVIPVSAITESGTTVIICYASSNSPLLGTVSGYTEIAFASNNGGSAYEKLTAAYQKFTTPQSGTTLNSSTAGTYPIGLSVVLVGA